MAYNQFLIVKSVLLIVWIYWCLFKHFKFKKTQLSTAL